jgi:hypothetical protein
MAEATMACCRIFSSIEICESVLGGLEYDRKQLNIRELKIIFHQLARKIIP